MGQAERTGRDRLKRQKQDNRRTRDSSEDLALTGHPSLLRLWMHTRTYARMHVCTRALVTCSRMYSTPPFATLPCPTLSYAMLRHAVLCRSLPRLSRQLCYTPSCRVATYSVASHHAVLHLISSCCMISTRIAYRITSHYV